MGNVVDDPIHVDNIVVSFSIVDGLQSKCASYTFMGWSACTEIMPMLEQIKINLADISKCDVLRDEAGTSYSFKLSPDMYSVIWRELSSIIGVCKLVGISKQSLRIISGLAREHAIRLKQDEIREALQEALSNLRACKEDRDRKVILETIAELAERQRAADPWKKPNDYATRVSPWRARA